MFGRKKSADRPDGEPTPASGRVRPEESVLDELSRAFGDPGQEIDDNASLLADDESFELAIVTSDDVGAAPSASTPATPKERRTIKIGDDFDDRSIESALPDKDVVITDRRPANSTYVIGGDDDLPDAVYLDGSGGLGDDSGTVFIDDDGTGDAIAVKDATTPGIEPRIRQRRIGVRRAENRKRIKWAALGLAGLIVVLGVLTVLGSGWFSIDRVDVTGAVYTDEERLAAVVDELEGTPVLLADTEEAERQLEAIPWVDSARVRTNFPDSATIEIRERTPVATYAGPDGRFRVLDDEGRVLDVIDGQPVAFVLLGGPARQDLEAGQFAPLGQAAAASLVTKLTPTVRPRVLSIDVTDDGSDLVMYLAPADGNEQTTPIQVRFGSAIGDNDQIEKLVRLENKLVDIESETVTEINVSTNEVTTL